MLTFFGASVSCFCTGHSRCDFLEAGALGIGGRPLHLLDYSSPIKELF
jgi:hypothetical protein